METALQEFIQAITANGLISINQTLIDGALKKEKEQIINFGLKIKNESGVESYIEILKTYESVFGDSNQAGI